MYEVFSKVGLVKKVRLQTEKDTGKSKGFAFVEYVHILSSAIFALKIVNFSPMIFIS